MGLFNFGEKARLKKENGALKKENKRLKKENQQLKNRHLVKDGMFSELMSDGLRHGSSLAGKHMSDRKKNLNGN